MSDDETNISIQSNDEHANMENPPEAIDTPGESEWSETGGQPIEEGKPDLTIPTTVSVNPEETNAWEDSMVMIPRRSEDSTVTIPRRSEDSTVKIPRRSDRIRNKPDYLAALRIGAGKVFKH